MSKYVFNEFGEIERSEKVRNRTLLSMVESAAIECRNSGNRVYVTQTVGDMVLIIGLVDQIDPKIGYTSGPLTPLEALNVLKGEHKRFQKELEGIRE